MEAGRSSRMSTVVVLVVAAAALIAACSVFQDGDDELANPGRADASDLEQIARGSTIYKQSCASCHGQDLEGQATWQVRKADGNLPAPPHDETGHTWHHGDDQLFDITKRGTEAVVGGDYKSDMLGFSDTLDDAEIWAVLAYIKSQWPADIQAAHARRQGS